MRTYSHDGIRDALTNLAAPPFLYEELRREIARAKRDMGAISLVRFVLAPSDLADLDVENPPAFSGQEAIVIFAHSLVRLSRDEEICARMGEREFVCLLHGKGDAVSRYVARIVTDWGDENVRRARLTGRAMWRLGVASVLSNPGENALELLNRLDLEILTSCE